MWDKLFSPIDLMQKGLEASWTRNAVIRNNIANVETPGFKASDLQFESIMARTLSGSGFKGAKTNERHIDIGAKDPFAVTPKVSKNENLSMRLDGNNVDIEAENVKLAQNSAYYNTLVSKLNSEIMRLRTAIRDGK